MMDGGWLIEKKIVSVRLVIGIGDFCTLGLLDVERFFGC